MRDTWQLCRRHTWARTGHTIQPSPSAFWKQQPCLWRSMGRTSCSAMYARMRATSSCVIASTLTWQHDPQRSHSG